MVCKVSLIAVTLALAASASPVVRHDGVRVDLPKRASLTRADGTFNYERATLDIYRTINKHRQNLINLEANRGKAAFKRGAHIPPPPRLPVHLAKRQSEPLTDQDYDTEWTGPITIGSDNQQFTIDFDTGSSDLWVPADDKTCRICQSKDTYNAVTSSTSQLQPGNFTILYGDHSTVGGPIFKDDVTVAGVKVTGQTFSAVTELAEAFDGSPIDGILGMAYQEISNLNSAPFFQTAFSQGAVKKNSFAFKLSSENSSLFLGGTDDSLFTGDIEFHPVTGSGYWQIAGGSIALNNKTVKAKFDTIIDSGTTLIYGPVEDVKAFYAAIPGSEVYDAPSGMYAFPCDSIPDISFTWGGNTWHIGDNFNFGQVNETSTQCVGAVAGQDMGVGDNTWLVGDSFMKSVYTVFDFEQNAVGFAELA